MKKLLLFIGCIIPTGSLLAIDTNVFYLPLDSTIHVGAEAKTLAKEEQLRVARTSPDSRPAELDIEGNWGKVVSGFQLSVRVTTNTVIVGEPISTFVILRNTTTNKTTLLGTGPNTIDLIVMDHQDVVLWTSFIKSPPANISGPIGMSLPGMRQIKYEIPLPNIFTNIGTYKISTKRRGVPDGKNGWTEIQSGTAILKVVSAVR